MPKQKIPFMAREMMEQPGIAAKLIKRRLSRGRVVFPELKRLDPGRIERVLFWGIGSSYHAAVMASYQMEALAALPCEHEQADEALARQAVVEPGALVVVISQSGKTGKTVQAARYAKRQGAAVLAVVNEKGSVLSRIADATINVGAGQERAVPATKTFFATGLALSLLALYFRQAMGRPVKAYAKALNDLPRMASRLLKADYMLSVFAEHVALAGRAVLLGQGLKYPAALEGALKLKETALIEAAGYASEEYRHGPEATLIAGLPIVLIASGRDDARLGRELLDRGADLVTIGRVKGLEKSAAAFNMPAVPEALKGLLAVLPLQQLALAVGLAKGLDVDKPKGLKKYLK